MIKLMYIILLLIGCKKKNESLNQNTNNKNNTLNNKYINKLLGSKNKEQSSLISNQNNLLTKKLPTSSFNDLNKIYKGEKDKIVLITGVASGLGKSFAKILMDQNWKVIGIDKDQDGLDKLVKELKDKTINFLPIKVDLINPKKIKNTSDKLKKTNRHPSMFILNAGTSFFEEDGTLDMKNQEKTFRVNYFGVIYWISEWMSYSLKNKGIFVGISSQVSYAPAPHFSGYSATKVAIKNAFESLRIQYYNTNIKFVTVLPGPMNTTTKHSKKIPFVQEPCTAAEHILKEIFKGKEIINFPSAYKILSKFSASLPTKIKNKYSKKFLPQKA